MRPHLSGQIVFEANSSPRRLCSASEECEGIGQAAGPGRSINAPHTPERLRVLIKVHDVQSCRCHRRHDLAESSLPLDGSASGEGVVDVAPGEVATVRSDARLVLVSGPQGHRGVLLVEEQMS
jgi:hypothetical protein